MHKDFVEKNSKTFWQRCLIESLKMEIVFESFSCDSVII